MRRSYCVVRCSPARMILSTANVLTLTLLAVAWPRNVIAQLSAPPANSIQTIAIPSYFFPGPLWTQMENASPAVGLAIINPNSGPGLNQDQAYLTQVNQSQANGLTVIGYVHTSYGGRSVAAVEAEINAYYNFYPSLVLQPEVARQASKMAENRMFDFALSAKYRGFFSNFRL